MTITVNGPGFSVNFPDGTDQATINTAMKDAHAKHSGTQKAPVEDGGSYGGFMDNAMAITPLGITQNAAKLVSDTYKDPIGTAKKKFRMADDFVRTAVDAIPLVGGAAQSLEAGTNSLINGTSFSDESTALERLSEDAFERLGTTGGVTAALAGNVLAGGALQAARVPGLVMSGVPQIGTGIKGGLSALGIGAGVGAGDAALRDDNVIAGAAKGTFAAGLGKVAGLATDKISSIKDTIFSPKKGALSIVDEAIPESNRAAVYDDLVNAGKSGDSDYMLMDAMGTDGAKLMNAITRGGGPAGSAARNNLINRQVDQGYRVQDIYEEGFNARDTAQNTTKKLTKNRSDKADELYGRARGSAGEFTGTNFANKIANDEGIRAKLAFGIDLSPEEKMMDNAARRVFSRDGNAQVVSFDDMLALRTDLSKKAQSMAETGKASEARSMRGIVKALDEDLADASPAFREANDTFAKMSKPIRAVDDGTNAATRGRHEDNIPAFRKLSPEEQSAFRVGYADKKITELQKPGLDKTRSFSGNKSANELPAFAEPELSNRMVGRLGRERRMSETFNRAIGGSKTADNISDINELNVAIKDPAVMSSIARGDFLGAAMSVVKNSLDGVQGLTPRVKSELLTILQTKSPQETMAYINQAKVNKAVRRKMIDAVEGVGMLTGFVGAEMLTAQ